MKGMQLIQDGKNARLVIQGPIDETCSFPENLKCDELTIDFEGLTRLNSFGIRLWINWASEKKGYQNLRLENCRQQFIRQTCHIAALIPEFASVESFYV